MTAQDTENSLERARQLVAAISDVAPPDHPQSKDFNAANADYTHLFERYQAALTDAVAEALTWWNGLIDLSMQRNHCSRQRAEHDALTEAPVGPASHGRVIAAVRRFWLDCDALNRLNTEGDRVPPEQFVLGWLIERNPALAAVLGSWTYFPVGLDHQSHWI